MTKVLLVALVVSITTILESSAVWSADDAIKQVFAELDDCVGNNDAKCVGELMIDEATFAAPTLGDEIVKGKAQIVKKLQENMKAPEPGMKGAKVTNAIRNVRMIGEDRAFVDTTITVAGVKAPEGAANTSAGSYQSVVLMVRKGGKWLFEDIRSYTTESSKDRPAPGPAAAHPAPSPS